MSDREQDLDESEGAGRPGLPVDPLRVWRALRNRWQAILITGVLGAFIGAAVAKKFTSQTFQAQSTLTWEARATSDTVERQTIVESITLQSNLEEVKERLGLEVPVKVLEHSVSVASSPTSNNVTVLARWPTAEGSAELANTVVDVFLEWRMQSIRDRLMSIVTRYREAVEEAQERQMKAAEAYEAFRRESGFDDISQERQLAIRQYAELATEADTARAKAEAAQSQLEGLRGNVAAASAISSVDALQARLEAERLPKARSELAQAKLQYAADHPNVRRLEAEVQSLEARVKARENDPTRHQHSIAAAAKAAKARQKAAAEYQAQLRGRLDKLSAVEGKAAVLLGELRVAEETLEKTKQMLAASELEASQPAPEFRVIEKAQPPLTAISSPRKRIALTFPLAFAVGMALLVIIWEFRGIDARTPKEAAFWSGLPVVGASTWPRDPEMLPSLMHDLDDYAPHAEGVTLIVGLSLDEAHLARRVAQWDGHRMASSIDDPNRLLVAGKDGSAYPLAKATSAPSPGTAPLPGGKETTGSMQILTLTGPVPAQALRRAGRLADRVLVVVTSGKHSVFQLMKIRGRLGRQRGIGVLLVGLEKDFALVSDRVGDVSDFWQSTRAMA